MIKFEHFVLNFFTDGFTEVGAFDNVVLHVTNAAIAEQSFSQKLHARSYLSEIKVLYISHNVFYKILEIQI